MPPHGIMDAVKTGHMKYMTSMVFKYTRYKLKPLKQHTFQRRAAVKPTTNFKAIFQKVKYTLR